MRYVNKVKSFILHLFYLLFGIVFCTFSIYLTVDSIIFKLNAERVNCEIVQVTEDRNSDNEICYDLYVSYSYGGIAYEKVKIDDWDKLMKVGDKVNFYCNAQEPKDLRTYEPSIFGMMVNFLPFLFGLIAFVIGISPILDIYGKKKLLRTGKVIYATIDSIEEIRRHKRNSIYELNCYYYDEFIGKAYRFKEMLFDNEFEKLQEGDTIKIVVKPEDYSHYKILL